MENWYGLRGKNGDYEKVLNFCDIAIDACVQYGKLSLFPFHIFNKGCALVKLGKILEGKDCIKDSFTILKQMKRLDDVEYGKKWLKESLNIEL